MSTRTVAKTRAAPARTTRSQPPAPPARIVNGQAVLRDEPVFSPLPPGRDGTRIPFTGLRLLTLADGANVFECADCRAEPGAEPGTGGPGFTGTRGQVIKHRAAEHGMRMGGVPGRPPRGPGKTRKAGGVPATPPLPATVASALTMPLCDVVELVQAAPQWGEAIARLTELNTDLQARLAEAEIQIRKYERAFAGIGYARKEKA